MVPEGSSGPLSEVAVIMLELGEGTIVGDIENPIELGGQGHVVKETYSKAVSVKVAVYT